jgi:predicted urease superfamily metal-dependent hydrolase
MGSITRSLSNNITTGGVILPAGITNSSVSAVTSFANAGGGTLILLSTQTASASANISFTTGLDSTYDEYIFKYINIHPASVAQLTI